MMIVDAQVHIWGANTPERPWPARAEPHRAPLGKEELLAEMDKAGVDGVVIVPPSWEGDRNDLAHRRRGEPSRPLLPSWAASIPTHPVRATTIAGLEEAEGHAGHALHLPHARCCASPCSTAASTGYGARWRSSAFPAMVLFHHEYMHLADKVAERYPGLRLVLDHLGLKSAKDVQRGRQLRHPRQGAGAGQAAQRGGQGLGDAVLRRRQDLSLPSVHPHIRRVFDAFGPKRTFWGTDWSRLPCSYRQGVTMFTEEMPWLKGEDLEWVMGRGVCEWIGWRN